MKYGHYVEFDSGMPFYEWVKTIIFMIFEQVAAATSFIGKRLP